MLQAFIITLREGVEAALIVGIVLSYLAKIGRLDLRKTVYAALGSAVAASIAGAVIVAATHLNQDVLEGWIMLVAAFFVLSMIVYMMRAARKLKGTLEARVDSIAAASSSNRRPALALFLFVFLMVLREGIETVLVLAAVSLNSTEIMSFLGTLFGIAVAVLFGVMFVKGSVRINLQKFFKVTTVILIFVAGQLVVTGLHELSESGILPSSRREMAVVGPIVRNDVFFFITILALAALMVLFEYRRRAPAVLAPLENKAEQRKAQWTLRRERWWMASVYASSFLFILLITAQFIYARTTTGSEPATELRFQDGLVLLPAAGLADGDLHRYLVLVDGVPVRFFLYRRPDSKTVAVLDACEICGGIGFYKSANGMTCRNCAAPINENSLGQAGGCNPIPIETTARGEQLVITQAALSSAAAHFAK